MEITPVALMTLDEWMRLYDSEGPFELIDGERVPVTPQIWGSSEKNFRLGRVLADFVETNGLGEVNLEAPFVLVYDSNWVKGSRVPDMVFIRAERLAELDAADPTWRETKPFIGAPDLIAEIASPTDQLKDVYDKIDRYLADGVKMVWLVEPARQTITIFTAGSNQFTRLTIEDTLTGGDLIPGFAVPLTRLFNK